MNEREANIDLLFRNGLKDYEVLPPPDVWDKINPAIRRRPFFFYLRVAATIALFTSIGVVAWMLGRNGVYENEGSFAILNISKAEAVKMADAYAPGENIISRTPAARRKTPVYEIPEKAEYNSSLLVLGNNLAQTGVITQPRSGILTIPEKANITSVPKNIKPGKFSIEMPEPSRGLTLPDKRWSISAMASPTYYAKAGSGKEEIMLMSAGENAAASYAGGIGLSYRINKRFSIQTGLYYSSYGQKIGGVNSFAGFSRYSDAKGNGDFMVMTSNGPVQTSNGDVFISAVNHGRVMTQYGNDVFDPEKANLSFVDNALMQNFSYIQMPVTVRYKLLDRNIDFNLLGGVSYDFLVGNNAFARTDGGKFPIGSTEGLNTLIFSSSVGMGMEYNFSEKVSLNMEPTFRYFLNPFNNSAGTRIHPYSFGIFSGFSYKF